MQYEEESWIFGVWCWFVTGFLWVMLLLALGSFCFQAKRRFQLGVYLALAGIGYIIMLVNSFSSTSYHFLTNPVPLTNLANLITKIYQAPPITLLQVECYHYEKKKSYEKLANGSYVKKKERRRVVTHTATEPIYFQSYRDISDPFDFDVRPMSSRIEYVKLRLRMNITHYNDGTYSDYLKQVEEFKRRNNRDRYQTFQQETKVQDFQEYVLVPIAPRSSGYVGSGWYTLFALLSGTELYKRYINQLTTYHEYTFVKVISTRTPNLYAGSSIPQVRVVADDYDSTYKRYF